MAYSKERVLDRIIKEICKEENINLKSFSYDWIHRLEKDLKIRYVFGYNFDINSSSVYQIANDKSATYELLNAANIPAVPHTFFMVPGYFSNNGNNSVIENILNLSKTYGYKVVCKINEKGSGGIDVYKATSKSEIEKVAIRLFSKTNSISISPLIDITNEYRCIVIDGEVKLIYLKDRQNVVGNGESTLKELICNKFENEDLRQMFLGLSKENAKLINEVIEGDQVITLNWKHNLGLGAEPRIINSGDLYNKIKDIAMNVSKELNIKFASIDIIEANNKLMVLEINSGVMMERFAVTIDNGYEIAKEIYKEAIIKMFE